MQFFTFYNWTTLFSSVNSADDVCHNVLRKSRQHAHPKKLFSGDTAGPTSQRTMAAASEMGFLPFSKNLLKASLKLRAWARNLAGERELGALSGKLGCTGGPLVCDVWATGDQGTMETSYTPALVPMSPQCHTCTAQHLTGKLHVSEW